jgi:lipopolysaccharide/colanic/teichoic acid biosynthesis glycosyltransferase
VVASVVMEGGQVSEGARLQRCVVAPGCRVPEGEAFADHLIFHPDHARRGPSVALRLQDWPGLLVTPAAAQAGRPPADGGSRRRWLFHVVKRTLDLCGATLGLAVTAPVLAVAAVAIEVDSPGPVLFRQRRVGLRGREFTMVKLRTMVPDAEGLQESLADRNEVDGPMFKIGNDPRITRVGRFLRATRIDEIPQLFNVLRGEMSLVGPRPLAMKEMRYNPAWRDIRLSVKPGATGLWQVDSRRKNSFQDWISADIRYVEQQSLWLDLQILGGTVREVWRTLWVREG